MRLLWIASVVFLPLVHAQNDWPAYGGSDPGGTVGNRRYSTLKQIDTGNVTKLTQAWSFNTRPEDGCRRAQGGLRK